MSTVIGPNVNLKGCSLTGRDDIIVKGKIDGDIDVDGNVNVFGEVTNGIKATKNVIVEKSGNVTGNIVAGGLVWFRGGKGKGNVEAGDRIAVEKGGVLYGDATCSSMSVDKGSIFDGACHILNNCNTNANIEPKLSKKSKKSEDDLVPEFLSKD